MNTGRLRYFIHSLLSYPSRFSATCPSCAGRRHRSVDRKYLFTTLQECQDCRLLFRLPKESAGKGKKYYENNYREGFVTSCPNRQELSALIEAGFKGADNDYTRYIDLLCALGIAAPARVLDFGCSWGYGVWQMRQAGIEAEGFEISEKRAAYGKSNLGIEIASESSELEGPFDCFFSSHVLEHVPSVSQVFGLARSLIRPGGLFVAVTPNGSKSLRAKKPAAFHRLWGLKHPNIISDELYRRAFDGQPFLLADSPFEIPEIETWKRSGTTELLRGGDELLVATVFS